MPSKRLTRAEKDRRTRLAFEEALIEYNQGRLTSAEAKCLEIIKKDPKHFDAVQMLGIIAYQNRKLDLAVVFFAKAVGIEPRNARVQYNLGRAFLEYGMLEEAEICYRKALQIEPRYAEALNDLGQVVLLLGRSDEARKNYRAALALKPDYVEALNNLGVLLSSAGRFDEATTCLEKAHAINPKHLETLNNLGTIRNAQGKTKEAADWYLKALKINPNFADTHYNLGNVRKSCGHLEESVSHYQNALALKPDFSLALNNLGVALQGLGKLKEAAAKFSDALALDENFAEAHRNLGEVQAKLGNANAALAAYDNAISLQADCAGTHYARSLVRKFSGGDPDIEQLRLFSEKEGLDEVERAQYLSALGEACDQIGSYDEAFTCFETANLLMSKTRPFDLQTYLDRVDLIKKLYSSAPNTERSEPGGHTPIFIVGMSRSGKTLTESILAQANNVFASGESRIWLHTVNAACQQLGIPAHFPENPQGITGRDADLISDAYLQRVLNLAPGSKFSVNTLPIHLWCIGLILTTISHARIIYCQRDAFDCCLRNFMRWYGTGQSYSNRLSDTAAYYKIYSDMMAFWIERFHNRILTVTYEEIVSETDDTTRKLFEFCGIEKDHPRAPQAFTTRDLGHWRNYEAHLQPLRDAFE